jgi:hypothetical protein
MNFDIFFDNPIIFIILVAVISSLFRKKKESSKDPKGQQRNNHPMEKKRSQTPAAFNEVREVFKEVSRSFSNPTASSNQKKERPYFEEKKVIKQQVEEVTQPMLTKFDTESMGSETPTPFRPAIQEKSKETMEMDGKKIVDAIIWSEILGPPRARKPFLKTRK